MGPIDDICTAVYGQYNVTQGIGYLTDEVLGQHRQYVFSESICPLSDRFLSLETCTRSLYSEKMFQGSVNTPPPSQIGNTNGEIVIQ